MPREISQREYDRQERRLAADGKAAAEFLTDMRELKRLIAKYPAQARQLVRK